MAFLSPLLFNVYINDLSMRLSETGIGGSIGGKFVSHMIYADDLCVIFFIFIRAPIIVEYLY